MVIFCRFREVGTSEDLAYTPYRIDPDGEYHDGCGMPLVCTQRSFARLSCLPILAGPIAVLIVAMAACGLTTVMETAPSGRCVSALALPLGSRDIAGMRTSHLFVSDFSQLLLDEVQRLTHFQADLDEHRAVMRADALRLRATHSERLRKATPDRVACARAS